MCNDKQRFTILLTMIEPTHFTKQAYILKLSLCHRSKTPEKNSEELQT